MRRNELHDLKVVKRGFDQQQVRDIVNAFVDKVEALSADNLALSEQVEQLTAESSNQLPDVFSTWSEETNELLDAARQMVSRVIREADADAQKARSCAEDAARTTREDARVEAETTVAKAEEHFTAAEEQAVELIVAAEDRAAELIVAAEQRAADLIVAAEQRAADLISDADRRVVTAEVRIAEVEQTAEMAEAASKAGLDRERAELHDVREHVIDLQHRARGDA